ncbi:intermembrane phospholipid transport protein YdbH family protein [Sphingobium yanoikuyae]|uniref:Exoprotein n=1 Tax=Sphingobium yanoikuyae TaxID=13690 RepID=A0A085K0U8_SPHYA|nr:YdbH domain-containing protein [Sphingobium yanoikuyae]AYO76869.1 exoprotein [Sphingobium yanoikuyae]KFD26344.1 exoprotein [Sphingobium yanoikuyae]KZC79177.1 exoprotein [Sphingobium yanoikuyae]MDV3479535.1 YdbH domain-containing protein [Sphingobium yanoikuyae]
MEDENGEAEIRRGWLRWLGVGTGSLGLVLVALWTQRAPIAENFVNRELNRRGVQANYDLTQVGLRTQRIENVVLGDPARPDLTARWVEVDIAFSGVTPQVAAVRASGVRMRGAYRDGVLTLGELDKFRDPDSTAPFAMPDLLLHLRDAQLRLDTDAGAVGMQIDGNGNLKSGFRGTLAAAMPRARMAGCGVAKASAWLDVAMVDGRPHLRGPIKGDALACADMAMAAPTAEIDLWLDQGLDRWNGSAKLAGEALKAQGMLLAAPVGRIEFDGSAKAMAGRARIGARAFSGAGVLAGPTELAGDWTLRGGDATFSGDLTARNGRMAGRDPLASLRTSTAGTPVAPLALRLADAARRAGADNLLRARVALAQKGDAGSLVLTDTEFAARSGAQVAVARDGRVTLAWPGKGGAAIDWALDGAITSQGGGLPKAALRLARRAGGGFGGQLFIDPYTADGARLAFEPVRFVAGPKGDTRFTTALRLDGPLPDGAVRGLGLPIDGRLAPNGAIVINEHCVPLTLLEARYGSFALGQTRQTLCPLPNSALFAMGPGGMKGGAELRNVALNGRSGDSPMGLKADNARLILGQTGFTLGNADFAIGPEDAPVRLSATSVTGAATKDGFAGDIKGAGGRIGTVPLIVEQGAGGWAFAKGALSLKAAMQVRDAQSSVRFNPLSVPDFALSMKDGRIAATGTLQVLGKNATVARADIAHDLGSGKGRADLTVPDLGFGAGLQPEELTPLTLGVIANVAGRVTGEGHIRWTGSDVSSDGVFRTDRLDLAAAFGPVEGLSGEIRFSDLLNMVTPTGQEARIVLVNPGVEARNGTVRYRLGAGQKVHIEGGGFPFSGGELVLLPTTMDFGADVDRYLTFRVIGLDAGAFIQAMDLKNVSATGTFDGIMPLIFNAQGGRVAGGVLVARQQGMAPLIMPEGVLPSIPCDPTRQSGVLSYVGPVSNEQVGVMGKVAFDALKDLQYKCLTILMDGALDGEMVTNVVFNGVNRGQLGGVPRGLAGNFVGLPFIFNVRIAAPFRGLMRNAQYYTDPTQAVRDRVAEETQEKMRAQSARDLQSGLAVQPVASETVRNTEPK